MSAGFAIKLSACPTCGARSASHPIVGETSSGGLVRLCPCGGSLGYDSGILAGPEIAGDNEEPS